MTEPQTSPVEAETPDGIGRRVARGVVLFGMRSATVYALQIVGSLVLARTLTPDAYGTAALGLAMTGGLRYVGDLGASTALVQLPGDVELRRPLQEMAQLIGIAVGLASVAIMALAGAMATTLFDSPASTLVLSIALGSTIVIDALGLPGEIRLRRRLAFRTLGVIDVVQSAVLYGVQVALLLAGWGIWAIVAGHLVRSAAAATLRIAIAGGARPRWHPAESTLLRRSLSFQAGPVAIGAVGFLMPVLMGALLSHESLGLWFWSTALAAPIFGLLGIGSFVGFPALSRMNADHPDAAARAAGIVLRTSSLFAAVSVGAAVGLVAPLIRLAFDERWLPAAGAARLYLGCALALAWFIPLSTIVTSRGDALAPARAVVAGGVVAALTAIPLVEAYGVTGAAVVTAIVAPVVQAALLVRRAQVEIVAPLAVAGCVVMVGGGLGWVLSGHVDNLPSLAAAAVATGTGSLIVGVLLERRTVRTVLKLLRGGGAPAR